MNNIDIFKERVTFYPDFPKKGIMFIDVLPLLRNAEVFTKLIHEMAECVASPNIASPEARGFLFAAPLLTMDNSCVESFIAFRKNAKLPAAENDMLRVPIVKEYGDDSLYFRLSDIENAYPTLGENPAIEITVFDDILATGGTAEGMAEHLNKLKVKTKHGELPVRVKEFVFIAEIESLNGKERLEKIAPVKSLILF